MGHGAEGVGLEHGRALCGSHFIPTIPYYGTLMTDVQ